MAHDGKAAELDCFRIFWEWHTGNRFALERLESMRNPDDPPDFVFQQAGEFIAMEHTHVFRLGLETGMSPLHSLQIARRVCKHLQSLLRTESTGIPPIVVTISFASCKAIRQPDEVAIAQRLLELISHKFIEGRHLPFNIFNRELASISPSLDSVVVTEGGRLALVCHYACGGVDESGLPAIQAAADRKAKDLARYENRFDQCWLLLAAGGVQHEQWIEPCQEACEEGIISPFDRVFLVDESGGHVYEVRSKALAPSFPADAGG